MEPLEGERTVSDVAPTKASWFTNRRKIILFVVGMCVIIAFIVWKDPGHKKPEERAKPPQDGMAQRVPYEPPQPFPMPAPLPLAMPPPPPPLPSAPQPTPQPLSQAVQNAVGGAAPSAPKPGAGARMFRYATEPPVAKPDQTADQRAAAANAAGTHVTYKAAEIVGGKAGAALDRRLLLMPGIIQAVLDTAIDSTLPGPLMAHLDEPVISDKGVVLMEKGTKIFGSYSNEVKQGQGRLLAVSATAYTPNGVPVPLGGPFSDGLGRSGLDGDVDNHYLQRFGAAVLLSLTDSVLQTLQRAGQSNGGNSYFSFGGGGGGSGVGSLAQQILSSTINIPPTITKPQGSKISLWILTPIDFSSSYKLSTGDR